MKDLLTPFVRYHLPALLWAAAIFAASSTPHVHLPNLPLLGWDKFVHAAVFFVLSWLVHRSLRNQTRFPAAMRHHLAATVLLVALYGGLDEIHQIFVPGRMAGLDDLAADAVGALFYAGVFRIAARRRSAPDAGI